MTNGYSGPLGGGQGGGQYGALMFLIQQKLSRCNTVELAKVVAVRPIGEEGPDNPEGFYMAGTVDVQLMVNMVTGDGEAIEHSTLFNLPYFRLQGGGSAIILDPQPGDIGIVVFCARDISVVKQTKEVSNPGSWGRFSFGDGLYLGGILNDNIPLTQYIKFAEGAINIVGAVNIIGSLTVNGVPIVR